MFTENLIPTKYCSRYWENSIEQNKCISSPCRAYILAENTWWPSLETSRDYTNKSLIDREQNAGIVQPSERKQRESLELRITYPEAGGRWCNSLAANDHINWQGRAGFLVLALIPLLCLSDFSEEISTRHEAREDYDTDYFSTNNILDMRQNWLIEY